MMKTLAQALADYRDELAVQARMVEESNRAKAARIAGAEKHAVNLLLRTLQPTVDFDLHELTWTAHLLEHLSNEQRQYFDFRFDLPKAKQWVTLEGQAYIDLDEDEIHIRDSHPASGSLPLTDFTRIAWRVRDDNSYSFASSILSAVHMIAPVNPDPAELPY